ncbi:MAG TPA: hypothetical protein VJ891_15275 [Casimicrobiaceae bacterium]|nr:hypothetical protein [Casimicrobiaceae bacterium]
MLIVLATWAIAMIAPDLHRVFNSLASFGLVVDNDGRVVDVAGPFETVADSPAAHAGIAVGDRLDLRAMRCVPVNTAECRSLLSLIGGLGGAQIVLPGSAIDLTIIPAAGGSARVVHLEARPAQRGLAERVMLLADTIVGIIVILAAARLVWLRENRMTWGFFLYAMWFNPGQTFAYYALLQPWPAAILTQEVAEALAHGAGYAGLLVFALRFPGDATETAFRRYDRFAWLLAAVIASVWLASFANGFGVPTETLTLAAFLLGYAVDVAVLIVLVKRRTLLRPRERQRMLWVICGCAIGLPAFILGEIAQSTSFFPLVLGWTPSTVLIEFLYLLNGVLIYFVSIAILRRRVVDVSIPLRRGTILGVLSLTVGIPIVNVHELLSHYQDTFRVPEWVWLLVVAPVALILLQRLHELGVDLVDRVLNRRFHVARRQLDDAAEAMLHARSVEEIDRLLVTRPAAALGLASAALFRLDDGVFRRESAIGWDGSPLMTLSEDDDAPVLRCIEASAPLRLSPSAWNRSGLDVDVQAPCIAAPVESGALGPIGVALYGPHDDGNDIDQDEAIMLQSLAKRAANGYERVAFVRLGEEVTELRARLDAQRAVPT